MKKLFFINSCKPGVFFIILLIVSLVLGQVPALAVTQNEEIELGRQVHVQLSGQKILFSDPIVNHYYQNICAKLLKAVGKQPYPFHFYIINSDTLNAFAVPGGYIYLHTETLIDLKNEGQLAAIMSHEIAHVTSHHYARRVESGKAVSIASLAGVLAGVLMASSGGSDASALGQALLIGSTGASIQAMLAYSRADEAEADRKGRSGMTKAGYNARDMYGAFYIMNENSYQLSGNLPSYLSTHPGLSSRLASTFADQASAPPAPEDPVFLSIRDRVLALSAQPRRIRSIMNERLSEGRTDASALHALGLLAAREQNFAQAEKLMNEALTLKPDNPEFLADLGDLALKRRLPAEAAKYYEKARNNPASRPQATLGLARSYELLEKPREAAVMYDEAVKMASDLYPSTLDLAGRFFGQNGQLAKGHLYLGDFFSATGQIPQAIFHYKAVLEAPGGSTYRSRCEQNIRDLENLEEKLGLSKKG